jgi:hypothetical protein
MSAELAINPNADVSKISPDKSKELTNCNACHDDGKGNAYSYKLRNVQAVKTFYNFTSLKGVSMSGGKIVNFSLTYPDVGASNMCVACHSGRLTGLNVKMADVRNMDMSKAKRIVPHFRGSAEMLFRPIDGNGNSVGVGFEFYSSGSGKLQSYNNKQFTHNIIGTTATNPLQSPEGTKGMEADSRGYGPCIGCHLNARGNDGTSHTFLPVNRTASSTYLSGTLPITGVTSKACAVCHTGASGDIEWDTSIVDPASGTTINALELQKVQYKAAVKAFSRLLKFAVDISATRVWEDGEGRPATPANWYGSNITSQRIQPWLRTATAFGGAIPAGGLDYYVLGSQFVDPLTGATTPIRNAAYTMGSAYNFFMLYYDPGAFAHNRRYAKRLIFDSMDWLDDGKLNKSVCDPTVKFTRKDTSGTYLSLNTYVSTGGIVGEAIVNGQNEKFNYATYLTDDELRQASYYLCRTGSSMGPDHRPAP